MKPCQACPFRDGETEEATQAQNLGCLPTQTEMIQGAEEHGQALSCHDNTRACQGLIQTNPKIATLPIKLYSNWYKNGWK